MIRWAAGHSEGALTETTVVRSGLSEGAAAIAVASLQAAGIRAEATPVTTLPARSVAVLVNSTDAKRARRILAHSPSQPGISADPSDHLDRDSSRLNTLRRTAWLGQLLLAAGLVAAMSGRAPPWAPYLVGATGVGIYILSVMKIGRLHCPSCGYKMFRVTNSWETLSGRSCGRCGFRVLE